jgi:hypothetical protein
MCPSQTFSATFNVIWKLAGTRRAKMVDENIDIKGYTYEMYCLSLWVKSRNRMFCRCKFMTLNRFIAQRYARPLLKLSEN